MSYHRSGVGLPDFASTSFFAEAVDPYAMRMQPPGSIYSPYGWGPDMNIGMPMNYTHHIGYERAPIPGARRLGPMYDQLGQYDSGPWVPHYKQVPFTNRGDVRYVAVGLGCGGAAPQSQRVEVWTISLTDGTGIRCMWHSMEEAARDALKEARGIATHRRYPMPQGFVALLHGPGVTLGLNRSGQVIRLTEAQVAQLKNEIESVRRGTWSHLSGSGDGLGAAPVVVL